VEPFAGPHTRSVRAGIEAIGTTTGRGAGEMNAMRGTTTGRVAGATTETTGTTTDAAHGGTMTMTATNGTEITVNMTDAHEGCREVCSEWFSP
jgi:hypothetical protein